MIQALKKFLIDKKSGLTPRPITLVANHCNCIGNQKLEEKVLSHNNTKKRLNDYLDNI